MNKIELKTFFKYGFIVGIAIGAIVLKHIL